jgi:hypothetical protein
VDEVVVGKGKLQKLRRGVVMAWARRGWEGVGVIMGVAGEWMWV